MSGSDAPHLRFADPIRMYLTTLLALTTSVSALLQTDTPLALENATVHTMVPGELPRVATVLVEDGLVSAVGQGLELPPGTRRVDLSGKHLVPALIDAFVHYDRAHDLLYTATGVGLVRDVGGGDHAQLVRERDPERRARALGPDLLTAGALLDGDPPSSGNAAVLRDPGAAEVLLQVLFDEQVDFLSTYVGLAGDVRRRVIELAAERDLEVWGPRARELTLAEAIAEGQAGFHALDALLPDGVGWDVVQPPAFRAGVEALAQSDTPLVPLVYAAARQLENQAARPESAQLLGLLSPTYTAWWRGELDVRSQRMNEQALAAGKRGLTRQLELLVRLHQAGVRLVPGSGTPQPWIFPGRSLHQELELWHDAGIPAADVLACATRGAAEALGVAGRHGSLEPGAVASALVLSADPTVDLGALRAFESLVVRGELFDQARVEDLLRTVAAEAEREREAREAALEVVPPEVPEGGVLLLEGTADTFSYGLRLWRECFRVVRMPDGETRFLGRLGYPEGQGPDELWIQQSVRDGQLAEAAVALVDGDERLTFEGIWSAESWRMRRTLGLQSLGVTTTRDRPVVLDTASVTTFLVLGQAPLSERFPIVRLHEGLEPEAAMWRMELDQVGNHQVRTHVGQLAFGFDEVGAITRALTRLGAQTLELHVVSRDAFGGAGLPLPLDKRERIAALRAAAEARAAAAEAETGQPSEGGPAAADPADAADPNGSTDASDSSGGAGRTGSGTGSTDDGAGSGEVDRS